MDVVTYIRLGHVPLLSEISCPAVPLTTEKSIGMNGKPRYSTDSIRSQAHILNLLKQMRHQFISGRRLK